MSGSPQPGTSQEVEGERMEDDPGGATQADTDGLFKVDTGLIPQAALDDQTTELQGLGLSVFNQDEFEQGVMKQVDKAMANDEAERLKRILNKELVSIRDDIRLVGGELDHIRKAESTVQQQNATPREIQRRLEAIRKQKDNKLSQLKTLKVREKVATTKLQKAEEAANRRESEEDEEEGSVTDKILGEMNGRPKKESERDRMIRLGMMTPFGTVIKTAQKNSPPVPATDFEKFLVEEKGKGGKKKPVRKTSISNLSQGSSNTHSQNSTSEHLSQHQPSLSEKKASNMFDEKDFRNYDPEVDYTQKQYQRKRQYKMTHNFSEDARLSGDEYQDEDGECLESDEEYIPDKTDMRHMSEPDTEDEDTRGIPPAKKLKKKPPARKTNAVYRRSDDEEEQFSQPMKQKRDRSITREKDDADESYYLKRLRLQQEKDAREDDSGEDEEFDGGLVVPGKIWKRLYKYQKTGVRWLWELHCQEAGGIIGDEMGLGKTIQMIAFLAALRTSKLRSKEFRYVGLGPSMIVCPATVMHQWLKEFHIWAPDFRVAILHSSGSYTGSEAQLVRNIVKSNGILVTSFNTLVIQQEVLLPYNWHYIVLDEGHKIRNPNAQVTLCCKQFRTSHRIILSGSPIQNNLKELWSLFDFVFPGKLGTLPDFLAHFSIPIVQGGYSNATQVQVETAYKCACVLRDTINPYLLRRMKADVQANLDLPGKSEQVLFCRLTDEQRDVYQEYLDSRECQAILAGKYKVFAGLINLRKICNHPDICTGGPRVLVGQDISGDRELEYGYWRRSGKLVVVEALLKLWHQQGHKVLLFSQSKAMLDIMEDFVQDRQYTYLRMDGTTPISSRQPLVAQFNKTKSIYVFLLTTRVGGLGVNLTGADRIIIYDPDWNPSTDMQARERAWRIGQTRQVTIYRLLTSGTIEEKIYHRQIFKQFLTNRVLKDPKQRRFFKSNDIFELFTLGSKDETGTETSAIFAGTGSNVHMPRRSAVAPTPTPKALRPNRFDQMKKEKEAAAAEEEEKKKKKKADEPEEEDSNSYGLDMSEMERMREFARKLSRQMEEAKKKKEGVAGSQGNGEAEKDDGNKSKKKSMKNVEERSSGSKSSSKQREHKKKKKKKDAKFEGQRIPNLVKSCGYQQQGAEPEGEPMNNKQQDDYVLRRLFKKTGIQGVMKHDKIMESGRADFALVEAEATKVAKEAVAALRRSRSMCMPASAGVPTWTGSHGSVASKPRFGQKKNSLLAPTKPGEAPAKPVQKKSEKSSKKAKEEKESLFDGSQAGSVALSASQGLFSSSDLLVRMHKRQELSTTKTPTTSDAAEDLPEAAGSSINHNDTELLEDIRNFIAFMSDVNGQATTQELITNFGPRLPPNESAKFKAMLLQICDFEKVAGSGRWILKQEFR
ncbi:DNA excision repair protein ERCC-6-like isoform X2 [Littorina saxatilis]|uniref:DNA excision repair protein ERCC-6 n=1 Tax=Littorina saxatilis TaxID=31220 RepID=A0AAN9C3H0_9CAEN